MHIQDGIFPPTPLGIGVLAGGAALAIAGTALGLRELDDERIPHVAVISAAFFVGSLIHLPVGPSSVHLILNGLAGLVLGWCCFPALLIALGLQLLLFGFGGVTTLGLNTANMAFPGVICYYLFRGAIRSENSRTVFAGGFGSGFLAVLLGAVFTGTSLLAAGRQFSVIASVTVIGHLPVMVAEGFVTGSVVLFLKKVKPEMLARTSPVVSA
ncbi:MAG: cobalt transporter CbiM [Candidatus Brocadiia bacterium]